MNTCGPFPALLAAQGRVLHFQRKLHEWASNDAERRFCDLWNLVCDPATLVVAWSRVGRDRGSRTAGVDAATRRHLEARGVDQFLSELREELRAGTFRPLPVRERLIPSAAANVAWVSLLCGIGRSRWPSSSSWSRSSTRTSTHQATPTGPPAGPRTPSPGSSTYTKAPSNYDWVNETDVEACFDRLSHCLILDEVRRRIKDKRVLGLIRAFLKAGVMTETGRLERTVTGTPHGGSPHPCSPTSRCPRWAASTRRTGRERVEALGLVVKAEKTAITQIDEGFLFLGHRIVRRPKGTSATPTPSSHARR